MLAISEIFGSGVLIGLCSVTFLIWRTYSLSHPCKVVAGSNMPISGFPSECPDYVRVLEVLQCFISVPIINAGPVMLWIIVLQSCPARNVLNLFYYSILCSIFGCMYVL